LESQPVQLGIYDTAMKFALGIELILIGLNGAARPEIFRFMKEGTKKHLFDIKRLSNILLAQIQIVIALAIFPVMIYLSFLYETDVRLASGIITIVFCRYILQAQYLIFLMPVYYAKKTRALFWINSAGLLVNVACNMLLIPLYGYYGAIGAGIFTQFLLVLLMYYYQKKMSGIAWNLNKTFYHPIGIVAVAVAVELLKNYFGLNTFAVSGAVAALMFASLYVLYGKDISLKKIKYHLHDPSEPDV
ncbi:MAG: polysaccharide biosynthesis C-terminal domain-containing protein, partial [Flavobacteriales bacterium]